MAERCWIVGSLPDCDICIDDRAVDERHCRLTQRGQSLLVEDLGSAHGTFVNGERIDEARLVRRGENVTLGRNIRLPWPQMARTVTIGRLPENDIVIEREMISGHHACLEQEGDRVYLVDQGSTNGTAINDPRNKIQRATIKATDYVFFGTHRVAAWELLKALPNQTKRRAEAEVANRETGRKREPSYSSNGPRRNTTRTASRWTQLSFESKCGIALCAALLLAVPFALWFVVNAASKNSSTAVNEHSDEKAAANPSAAAPSAGELKAASAAAASSITAPQHKVRLPEEAVVLIGVRIDKELVIDSVSAWACGPSTVICPTSRLELLEKKLRDLEGLDTSLVVCAPKKTLAIIEHRAGNGPAQGFSLARLEAPLDETCTIAGDAPLQPQQELTVLDAHYEKKDDPKSIVRRAHPLRIDHIERSGKTPSLLHCRGDQKHGELLGAPVFDREGSVVGCVGPSAEGVDVVPISRLNSLISEKP
jgi:pSer/pThr/pTyr-binding forkhead associated (FHA) protein